MRSDILVLLLALGCSQRIVGTGAPPLDVESAPDAREAADPAPPAVDAPSADAATATAAACRAYAERYCARMGECSVGSLQIFYGGREPCVEALRRGCVLRSALPGQGYDVAALDACGRARVAQPCAEVLLGRSPDACRVRGTLPENAACSDGAQCRGGVCARRAGEVCGVCATLGGPGEACGDSAPCESGLLCSPASRRCAPPLGLGERCDFFDPRCAGTLRCVPRQPTSVCEEVPTSFDAACDFGRLELYGCNLAAGLYCDPSTSRCREVRWVAPGEPCGMIDGVYAACAGVGVFCPIRSSGGMATCPRLARDGEECEPLGGVTCAPPATCVPNGTTPQGVCRTLAAQRCPG